MSLARSIRLYLGMIRFSHSIFALPFAFTAAIIAANGLPTWHQVIWITAAMIGARSGAMGFNRLIDRRIDAKNPRTASRELPAGKISVPAALAFSLLSFALMVYAAYMLNPLCLMLSPVAIFFLVLYSYTKRFTALAHFALGVAIAGAPLGAWIAITGQFDMRIMPLVAAVFLWLPGFDILYALQDLEFDRSEGLHSIPSRFGVERSIIIARVLHFFSWALIALNGVVFSMGAVYFAGTLAIGGLFLYEHSLVRGDDLSKLDLAFFNMNGYISMAVFVFTIVDIIFI